MYFSYYYFNLKLMNRFLSIFVIILFSFLNIKAQTPNSLSSADIFLGLKKLNVLGTVLYVGAHPDDENTRLLSYLSKEQLYRTGYLSLTRGDGGQNLIGDEQGIELGLIRTQELLAARRMDAAEQFFSRAYDFGFSKSTEEAISIWGKENILSDVVWIIRKFQPDVIITRFPDDNRAGHGHHSASAYFARMAFKAAADPNQFPDQLAFGVKPWQVKRVLWNTFNFGGNNTTSEDQLKLDVGMLNPLLGKSYGEIASESRSQHKSQGFGVARQRGQSFEYFTLFEGDKASTDLMENISTSWKRLETEWGSKAIKNIEKLMNKIINEYQLTNPEKSVSKLIQVYKIIQNQKEGYWKEKKLQEINDLIVACSGLFAETTSSTEYVVNGDVLKFNTTINNRYGLNISIKKAELYNAASLMQKKLPYPTNEKLKVQVYSNTDNNAQFDSSFNLLLSKNINVQVPISVNNIRGNSQPYWLANEMKPGHFEVYDQRYIGMAESNATFTSVLTFNIEGLSLSIERPLQYKHTDPVKGELYEPFVCLPKISIAISPNIILSNVVPKNNNKININYNSFINAKEQVTLKTVQNTSSTIFSGKEIAFQKNVSGSFAIPVNEVYGSVEQKIIKPWMSFKGNEKDEIFNQTYRTIRYDHIPTIHYFYQDFVKVVDDEIKTVGKKVGYINGAGDKVPQALQQMGYDVTVLEEKDITTENLKSFQAIITGVRAYNINEYLTNKYDVLIEYIQNGGNLIVQYNTNNQIGPVKAKIAPYDFTISRNRVTNENAIVNFDLPNHSVLNFPNKITAKDFEGWVQERSIYHADKMSEQFSMPLSMADAGEKNNNGALVIAPYGKGNFVYTGIVFFRELPAGVGGAYRLFANLIALPKN